MLPPVRVLGVGSPFGLDALAWQVVECLHEFSEIKNYLGRQLLIENLDRPGVNLLRYFSHAEHVFLIDVMLNEKVLPGEVVWYCKEEISQAKLLHSSHGFGVQETIALAESLGQLPRQMDVIAISIGDGECHNEVAWNGIITAAAERLKWCIAEKCERVALKSVMN